MTNKYLKDMFNFVKGLETKNSKLAQYNSYEQYRKSLKGDTSLEDWQEQEGFTDDDKANFKDVFGGESY